VYTQYIRYWMGVLHGDLGTSIRMHDSVNLMTDVAQLDQTANARLVLKALSS
jgi:ABC-type dipeptide/oligopeptide/nickel transport system permease component